MKPGINLESYHPKLYVQRPREENMLQDWVEDDGSLGRVIAITGEPGIGKTWLAQHISRAHNYQLIDTSMIEAQDTLGFFTAQLWRLAQKLPIKSNFFPRDDWKETWHSLGLSTQFRYIHEALKTTSDNFRAVVVCDQIDIAEARDRTIMDFTDTQFLAPLLLSDRVRVILGARAFSRIWSRTVQEALPPTGHRAIVVQPFTREQASELFEKIGALDQLYPVVDRT